MRGKHGEQERFLALVDRVYAAALDERAWPEVLRQLASLLGGTGATLELHDLRSGQLEFFESADIDPSGTAAYVAHYAAVCPRVVELPRHPAGTVMVDRDHITEAQMDRDEFYADFLARYDLRYYVSGTLANDGTRAGVIAVQRTRRSGHASATEVALMQRVLPHVRRALDVALRIRGLEQDAAGLAGALDRLRHGVVLVDRQGRVRFANREAVTLLDDGALAIRAGMLVALDAGDRPRLAKLLAAAIAREGLAGATQVGAMHPRGPLYVTALPLSPVTRAHYADRLVEVAMAAVFVSRVAPPPAEDLLHAMFGFTAAETRLAMALLAAWACASTPPAIASRSTPRARTSRTSARRLAPAAWPTCFAACSPRCPRPASNRVGAAPFHQTTNDRSPLGGTACELLSWRSYRCTRHGPRSYVSIRVVIDSHTGRTTTRIGRC
jgi:hypothetical protein